MLLNFPKPKALLFGILLLFAVSCVSCLVTYPLVTEGLKLGKETAAIATLQTIHNGQAQYHERHNRFGTLKELAEAGLISAKYTNRQPVAGYVYSDSDVSAETYSVSATSVDWNWRMWLLLWESVPRSFVTCEDGTIRVRSTKPTRQPQHCEGQPILEPPAP